VTNEAVEPRGRKIFEKSQQQSGRVLKDLITETDYD